MTKQTSRVGAHFRHGKTRLLSGRTAHTVELLTWYVENIYTAGK